MKKDYPLEECALSAHKLVLQGMTVYQKWTCEKCGDRVTANDPNIFTTEGHHENCGHITDIRKSGCNYLVVASTLDAQVALLKRWMQVK